jgi:dihydroneopterin aldolase
MDSIIARGMTFQGCHGVMGQEKINPQTFKVDLEMFLDLQTAGKNDDLQSTINYDQVFHLVEIIVTEESYALIEALAEQIAQALLFAFPLMDSLDVTVYKPEAPVQGDFEYFAVKIKRFQK